MKKQLEELKQALLDLDKDIEMLESTPHTNSEEEEKDIHNWLNQMYKERISLQGEIIYLTALISTQS